MFGLKNQRGSCWVNAALQGIFRIPDVQERFLNSQADPSNTIDVCLQTIWTSKGDTGLQEFYDASRTDTMPAGHGLGDSHELIQYLCDKLPFLDKLCRFRMANSIVCSHCKTKDIREDSVIEFEIHPEESNKSLSECIAETVTPIHINDWKCEKCNQKGCEKQFLIGSFPKVMIFHMTSLDSTAHYSSILVLNKKKYALLSVICYNGFHWWTYGRNLPVGSSWYTIDDSRIIDHGASQFPIAKEMRMLIYYRLDD